MSMTVEPVMRSRHVQISNLPADKQEQAIEMLKRRRPEPARPEAPERASWGCDHPASVRVTENGITWCQSCEETTVYVRRVRR